jgi:hypothetical protein
MLARNYRKNRMTDRPTIDHRLFVPRAKLTTCPASDFYNDLTTRLALGSVATTLADAIEEIGSMPAW